MQHAQTTSEQMFLIEMIPHHQEAVDTSKEILATTQNEHLKDLAQRIVDAQEKEIVMMQNWTAMWYPEKNYTAAYQNMMPPLQEYSGKEKDMAYLQGMTHHHMMAVVMAQDVLKLNPRSEVADFARHIISVQQQEMQEMSQITRELNS
jgi:uncharacterized protein (DUF305 family)